MKAKRWSAGQVDGVSAGAASRRCCSTRRTLPVLSRGASPRPASIRTRCATLADLAACPYSTKQDLLDHLPEMVSTQFPPSERLYITTGGSTGVPVGFYLHKGVSRPKEQAFLEAMWRRAGYFDGARLAVIRGHVTSSRAGGPIVVRRDARLAACSRRTISRQERLPEYLEALERFQPDLLHAYPSAALQLAEYLEHVGSTWTLSASRGAVRVGAADDSAEADCSSACSTAGCIAGTAMRSGSCWRAKAPIGAVLLLSAVRLRRVRTARRRRGCAK